MVIDAFTFFNELDMLELRLDILGDYVDKFILVESRQTFTGHEKPLYYQDNLERFAKWNDKIIHIVAPNIEIKNVAYERHWLCYELIEQELMKFDAKDICFCSDLDEIWNPEVMKNNSVSISWNAGDLPKDYVYNIDENPHSLIQLNYSYWLNYRSNEQWTGTIMAHCGNVFVGFNKQNRTLKPNMLTNGGWHFTNMGGVEQIKKKVAAYDHGPEIPQEWFQGQIAERMEKGQDYLARNLNYDGKPFEFKVEEENWPQWLKENKQKYVHLCKS